jgi:hypothetical protein
MQPTDTLSISRTAKKLLENIDRMPAKNSRNRAKKAANATTNRLDLAQLESSITCRKPALGQSLPQKPWVEDNDRR